MIFIGNGPFPLAHPGPPGPGTQTAGTTSRVTAAQNTGAPQAAIPAAAPERTGQSPQGTSAHGGAPAIRTVLAPSRTDSTATDSADRYRMAQSGSPRETIVPQHLEHRQPPAPPLDSYAAVPMEVTAEIQRLRSTIAEMKQQIEDRDRQLEQARGAAPASAPLSGDAAPVPDTVAWQDSMQPSVNATPANAAAPSGCAADLETLRQNMTAQTQIDHR